MKNVLFTAQHGGKDTEDANRRPEMKVLPKVQVRDEGTRQILDTGGVYHT